MSQAVNVSADDLFPEPKETRDRCAIDRFLARIARDIKEVVRLFDAAEGDSLPYSAVHEPVMALFALIEEADVLASALASRAGVTAPGRDAAESARTALELSRTALTIAVGRSDINFNA